MEIMPQPEYQRFKVISLPVVFQAGCQEPNIAGLAIGNVITVPGPSWRKASSTHALRLQQRLRRPERIMEPSSGFRTVAEM